MTKKRQAGDGTVQGGKPFSRGHLYQLLSNPIYVGEIAHRKQTYPGLHAAIIGRDVWDAIQTMLADNSVGRNRSENIKQPSLLTGLIFDETGDRLSPNHRTLPHCDANWLSPTVRS